jgi:hypothetical protein
MKRKALVALAVLSASLLTGCVTTTSPNLVDRGSLYPQYVRLKNTTNYGYEIYTTSSEQVINDPYLQKIVESSPHGIVEKFHLKDGDCSSFNGTTSDCKYNRERSELTITHPFLEKPNTGEYWYEWNLLIPQDYEELASNGAGTLLGQFYQYNFSSNHDGGPFSSNHDGGPTYEVMYRRSGLFFAPSDHHHNRLVKANGGTNFIHDSRDAAGVVELHRGKLPRDQWLNFKVHANWSCDPDVGFLKLYYNNTLKVDLKGRNSCDGSQHLKYGLYRYNLQNHRAINPAVPEQRVFYSNFKIGRSKKDLE